MIVLRCLVFFGAGQLREQVCCGVALSGCVIHLKAFSISIFT